MLYLLVYDNGTSTPLVAALSPSAEDHVNTSDNLSYNAVSFQRVPGLDNRTGFTGNAMGISGSNQADAAAAWCNDGSAGGALWVAISADNLSGFTLSKWTDNATIAAAYFGLFALDDVSTETGNDNNSSDNITSLSMACDSDDYMPVLAVGYDSTAGSGGDYALAKFDNNTNVWEELLTATDAATPQEPVTVSVSSDGSVFALGFNNQAADNGSIVLFYDE